jgi:hypothetical protein
VEFVLDNAEKLQCLLGFSIIVNREGIKVADFLIKALLRGANIPDAFQKLVKVVCPKDSALFEPLVVL